MITGNEPITPTVYRQTGETESRIATPKDIQQGIYLLFEPGLTIRQYYSGLALSSGRSADESLQEADKLIKLLNETSN